MSDIDQQINDRANAEVQMMMGALFIQNDDCRLLDEGIVEEAGGNCCICGVNLIIAHNPEPVKHEGHCCSVCNAALVTPTRMALSFASHLEKQE